MSFLFPGCPGVLTIGPWVHVVLLGVVALVHDPFGVIPVGVYGVAVTVGAAGGDEVPAGFGGVGAAGVFERVGGGFGAVGAEVPQVLFRLN